MANIVTEHLAWLGMQPWYVMAPVVAVELGAVIYVALSVMESVQQRTIKLAFVR